MSSGTDEGKTKHDENEVAKVLKALDADFSSDMKRCKRLVGKKSDTSNKIHLVYKTKIKNKVK